MIWWLDEKTDLTQYSFDEPIPVKIMMLRHYTACKIYCYFILL